MDNGDNELREADCLLAREGIPHSVLDLYYNHALASEYINDLLRVWKLALENEGIHNRALVLIADVLFDCQLSKQQKHEAVNNLFEFIKDYKTVPVKDIYLDSLIVNTLVANLDKTSGYVNKLGEMLLNRKYGRLREQFTFALKRLRNKEAVPFLLKAAKESTTAAIALDALSVFKVKETLPLCEEALNTPGIEGKDAIKETYTRLQKKLLKKVDVVHVTEEEVPAGLSEFCTNIDAEVVDQFLRGIWKCFDSKNSRKELAEIKQVIIDLAVEQNVRMKFDKMYNKQKITFWLEVFCDDEAAYDIYIFGPQMLIDKLDAEYLPCDLLYSPFKFH